MPPRTPWSTSATVNMVSESAQPHEDEGDGEARLGPQQQPFSPEAVGEPPPQGCRERTENGGHHVQHTGPAGRAVAEFGQYLREVRRQPQRGERRHEVAGGHGVHLPTAERGAGHGKRLGGHAEPPSRRR